MEIQKYLLSAFLLAGSLLHAEPCLAAKLTDVEARERARAAVRSALNMKPDDFLSVHRREEIEDSIFDVQRTSRVTPPPYVYELSDSGYEISGDGIVKQQVTVDGGLKCYVVVFSESGDVYRLFGFRDSDAEFSRLLRTIRPVIRDKYDATNVVYLYLESVLDLPPPGARLYSSFETKQSAEKYFHEQYSPQSRSKKLFMHWWIKNRNLIKKPISSWRRNN